MDRCVVFQTFGDVEWFTKGPAAPETDKRTDGPSGSDHRAVDSRRPPVAAGRNERNTKGFGHSAVFDHAEKNPVPLTQRPDGLFGQRNLKGDDTIVAEPQGQKETILPRSGPIKNRPHGRLGLPRSDNSCLSAVRKPKIVTQGTTLFF